jgi:hypothetical protein
MQSNALPSQGMKVGIGSGSPLTYNDIPEVVSFSGPGGSGQVIDVTNLASTAIEKVMGLPDEGQLSFEINYVPTNTYHAALRTARANKTLTKFKLTFTDVGAMEWTFSAYVTGFTVSGGVNATVKASVTLEISGSIVETA